MSFIEMYHYGDCGNLDKYNPFKLFSEKYTKEILYNIGKAVPYTLGIEQLSYICNIEISKLSKIIDKMTSLDLIDSKNGLFKINFTTIYEKDLDEINRFSNNMAKEISQKINNSKEKIIEIAKNLNSSEHFSIGELLYHIIGSYILDGLAIDTLSKKGYFKISKLQKDNRDYILFGFEKSDKVDAFSENILCSCNNYRTQKLSFVSFGDAAGDRNDVYRFNRQVALQLTKIKAREDTKNSYINLAEKYNNEMISRCANVVEKIVLNNNEFMKVNEEDLLYAKYLKSLNYLEENLGCFKVSVPIFYQSDMDIIKSIHDILIEIIEPIIQVSFKEANANLKISAVEHGVDIEEILNEMWHQVFGNINELLVEFGLYKKPDYFEGEGRYLKAIYMNI